MAVYDVPVLGNDCKCGVCGVLRRVVVQLAVFTADTGVLYNGAFGGKKEAVAVLLSAGAGDSVLHAGVVFQFVAPAVDDIFNGADLLPDGEVLQKEERGRGRVK